MFRELAKSQTPLAAEVRVAQASGNLISDDLVIRVVRERTGRDDCKHGYVLDGFPRTPAQAATLEKLAVEQGKKIQAIEVAVPRELLEKRMTGRRNCPVCNEIYNVYFKPPRNDNVCDLHPTAQLLQRADDNAETVEARLATYDEQTSPLIEYYRAANILRVVDGTQDPEAIFRDIEKIVRGDE
jgi:adenylate kinase